MFSSVMCVSPTTAPAVIPEAAITASETIATSEFQVIGQNNASSVESAAKVHHPDLERAHGVAALLDWDGLMACAPSRSPSL